MRKQIVMLGLTSSFSRANLWNELWLATELEQSLRYLHFQAWTSSLQADQSLTIQTKFKLNERDKSPLTEETNTFDLSLKWLNNLRRRCGCKSKIDQRFEQMVYKKEFSKQSKQVGEKYGSSGRKKTTFQQKIVSDQKPSHLIRTKLKTSNHAIFWKSKK